MSTPLISLRGILLLSLPLAAALIIFGVNGSWRSSASVPGFTLVVTLGLLYLLVLAAGLSSSLKRSQEGPFSGVRADAAESFGIEVRNAVPWHGSPAKAVVVGSKGSCPIGLATGYRVKLDSNGTLSEPVCRGAAEAISGVAHAKSEGRDLSTACTCPLGPQRLWFAFKESV